MEPGYISINQEKAHYQRALARFREDPAISDHNKGLVLRFLHEAALGKTSFGRRRKTIGPSRLHTYVSHLRILIAFVQKDLDTVRQGDMECFIVALDTDVIRSRGRAAFGNRTVVRDTP